MIQRIQSIYLFAAAVLAILFYLFPLAVFDNSTEVFEFYACHIKSSQNTDLGFNLIPLAVLPVLSTLISLLAIFSFKNRALQMKLGKLNYLVLFSVLIVSGIYFNKMSGIVNAAGNPGFIAIFPVISIIFVFMANRAIKKDDRLIKSADRIR
ncbi:MAG: DUF4293 domain-containing protein [Salinivirgaceae bacterium]|nr:DUF4293 domain-containing protein [Salinivirgaceae bacterium]